MAGGASQAVGYLVGVSGASNTLLDVQVPYSEKAFDELLPGPPPAQYVRAPHTPVCLRLCLQSAAHLLLYYRLPSPCSARRGRQLPLI